MIFYNEARVDGLQKRVETPTEMTETFIKREDFLYYRHVEFGKRAKKFGPAENSSHRPILVSLECANYFFYDNFKNNACNYIFIAENGRKILQK